MLSFPKITHIDQIRKAIEGRPELYIAEREFGYVANYMVQMPTTFVDDDYDKMILLRECRGLMFGPDGTVIARRFHKFFNLGEKVETFPENFNYMFHHYYLMDKLDGSMITPIPMPDGEVRWGTKMGLTDVALPAEHFARSNPVYTRFADEMIEHGLTPIFEWTSRKQRIVIDYPEDNLVLLALRENVTGLYTPMWYLKEVADYWKIPLCNFDPLKFLNTKELTDWVETLDSVEGTEGYVIRFDDGNMVKVKTPWYKRLHKAKEHLVHEKNIVEMIVREQLDDLKDALQADDLAQLEKYEAAFVKGLLEEEAQTWGYYEWVRGTYETKKDFALGESANSWIRPIIFKQWDKTREELMPILKQIILSNVSTQTKVDSTRHLWGNAKWNYGAVNE